MSFAAETRVAFPLGSVRRKECWLNKVSNTGNSRPSTLQEDSIESADARRVSPFSRAGTWRPRGSCANMGQGFEPGVPVPGPVAFRCGRAMTTRRWRAISRRIV